MVFNLLTRVWLVCLVLAVGQAEIEKKELKVVASFYPNYIMAKNVLQNAPRVSLTMLAPPMTGCLHDYAPTVSDMKKLATADIFIANGAGMESFLERVLKQYPHIQTVNCSEGIKLINGHGAEGDNPHVWVGISEAIAQVKNIGKNMEKLDPEHKRLYKNNTMAYVSKLEMLRQEMHKDLNQYKGKQIITFHEAFPYFAAEFELKIAAVIEREPGSEPSAKELANTIKIIRQNNIAALFSEPQYPALAARTVAKETGSKIYVLDPAVTGPDDKEAYINIMKKNLQVLKNAFAKK